MKTELIPWHQGTFIDGKNVTINIMQIRDAKTHNVIKEYRSKVSMAFPRTMAIKFQSKLE